MDPELLDDSDTHTQTDTLTPLPHISLTPCWAGPARCVPQEREHNGIGSFLDFIHNQVTGETVQS